MRTALVVALSRRKQGFESPRERQCFQCLNPTVLLECPGRVPATFRDPVLLRVNNFLVETVLSAEDPCVMLDPSAPDIVFFPDPQEITPHAIAFARMMFAHAALDREVSALQDAITKEPGFGEQRCNQWGARERSARMVKLIAEHRGNNLAQTELIAKLLADAVDPCDQRNLLAHGTWWCFRRPTSTIVVRSGTRWQDPDAPPDQREYTASDIELLTDKFETIEAEIYKLRRAVEPPTPTIEIAD